MGAAGDAKRTSDRKKAAHPFLARSIHATKIIHLQGYKVYFTTNPNQPEASWDSQMVDNSELTTISELTPHAIYTVRVQAFTSMGAGPMSNPVKVKTQQGKGFNQQHQPQKKTQNPG